MQLSSRKRSWIPISGNFISAKDIATHWIKYKGAGRLIKGQSLKWRIGRSILITDSDKAEQISNNLMECFDYIYT